MYHYTRKGQYMATYIKPIPTLSERIAEKFTMIARDILRKANLSE